MKVYIKIIKPWIMYKWEFTDYNRDCCELLGQNIALGSLEKSSDSHERDFYAPGESCQYLTLASSIQLQKSYHYLKVLDAN